MNQSSPFFGILSNVKTKWKIDSNVYGLLRIFELYKIFFSILNFISTVCFAKKEFRIMLLASKIDFKTNFVNEINLDFHAKLAFRMQKLQSFAIN